MKLLKDIELIGDLAGGAMGDLAEYEAERLAARGIGARASDRPWWLSPFGQWHRVVQPGETASSIADDLGMGLAGWSALWRYQDDAYKATRDPSALRAGDVLRVPPDVLARVQPWR